MKTSFISTVVISSALLITACTPQDKAVVDKNLRNDIVTQNERKAAAKNKNKIGSTTSNKSPSDFYLGDQALAALLAEKNIEAVELIKVAVVSLDPKQTSYSVESLPEDKSNGLEMKKISFTKESLEYSVDQAGWKSKGKKEFVAALKINAANIVESVSIKGANVKTTVDSADKNKFYVNLSESTYELNLSAATEKTVNVTVKSEGTLNGAKGGDKKDNKITISLDMTIDKESLSTSDVKVLSASSKIEYPGFNGKTFNVILDGQNLSMTLKSFCNEFAGEAVAKAGPKKTYNMSMGNEEIKIGKDWTSKLATCGKRPTVDLSRLQK